MGGYREWRTSSIIEPQKISNNKSKQVEGYKKFT